jgi:hypothetical protein
MRSHFPVRLLALLPAFMLAGCGIFTSGGTTTPASTAAVAPRQLAAAPTKAEVRAWLVSGNYQSLDSAFSAIQADYRSGARSDESLYDAFHVLYDAEDALSPAYDGWVATYPHSYVALLARGIYHRKVGQKRRGGASIDSTSPVQLRGMDAEYTLAMRDLEASKVLDARPLLTLVNELDIAANYGEASRMEALLNASKKMDPANIIVRRLYLSYLAPRWGGSEQQLQDFVRQARGEGLPETKLQALEAVIAIDHAQTAEDSGDDATAERDYRQAMQLGDDACAKCLGRVLIREQKHADAIPVLTQAIAADASDDGSLYWRGESYLATGRSREGFADLLAAANLGNPDAENRVGVFYMTGLPGVVDANPDQGLRWLRQCATTGNTNCVHNMQVALQSRP